MFSQESFSQRIFAQDNNGVEIIPVAPPAPVPGLPPMYVTPVAGWGVICKTVSNWLTISKDRQDTRNCGGVTVGNDGGNTEPVEPPPVITPPPIVPPTPPSCTLVSQLYPIYIEEPAMTGAILEIGSVDLMLGPQETMAGSLSSIGSVVVTSISIRESANEPAMSGAVSSIDSAVVTTVVIRDSTNEPAMSGAVSSIGSAVVTTIAIRSATNEPAMSGAVSSIDSVVITTPP